MSSTTLPTSPVTTTGEATYIRPVAFWRGANFINDATQRGDIAALNSEAARILVNFRDMAPSQPSNPASQADAGYSWAATDTAVNAIWNGGAGKRVLIMFHGAPTWAGGSGADFGTPSSAMAHYFGYAAAMVTQRYQAKMVTWPKVSGKPVLEIWNEPNISAFGNLSAYQYAELAFWAQLLMHATGVSGSKALVGSVAMQQGGTPWQTFLRDTAIHLTNRLNPWGINGQWDVSIHPYPQLSAGTTNPPQPSLAAQTSLDLIDQAKNLSGIVRRGLWLTEAGQTCRWNSSLTTSTGRQNQSSYYQTLIGGLRQRSIVRALFPYRLADLEDSSSPFYGFGIESAAGVRDRSFAAVKAAWA